MKTRHFTLQNILRMGMLIALVLGSINLSEIALAGGGGSTGGSGGSRTVSNGTHAVTTSRSLANQTARNLNTGTGGYRVPNGSRAVVTSGYANGSVRVDVRPIERSDGNNRGGLPVRPNPGPGGPGTVTPGPGGPGIGDRCVANQGQSCQSASVNMCNQRGSGQISCTGSCTATALSDTVCTNQDIVGNGGGITATPAVVRVNDPVTIVYDVGSQNYPENCTLTGPGVAANYQITVRQGQYLISSVTGPHQYTLACGTASVNLQLRVLPAIYES